MNTAKHNLIFKEVENKARDIMKKKTGGIEDGAGNFLPDAVFGTSHEQDVRELIDEGFSVDEIISKIKKW